jgi:hypothetical protein
VDIFSGYDDLWYFGFNWMRIFEDSATGDVILLIGEVDWGYEVLMTRWLTETGLCLHEPYYEDMKIWVNYSETSADFYLDSVATYSLRAVCANESATNEGAWAWEPSKIDYVSSWSGGVFHPSFFDPYVNLTYKSRSPGDFFYGTEVGYDATPWWFNLTAHQKLIIQLPTGTDVVGFLGQGVPTGSLAKAQAGDISPFTALMYNGTMSLGHYVTDGVDLGSMYNPGTKTLTINGPVNFDYERNSSTELLYHGAPWIEFNVSTGMSALALPTPVDVPAPSSSGPVAAGSASIVAAVLLATIAVTSIGVMIRRRE